MKIKIAFICLLALILSGCVQPADTQAAGSGAQEPEVESANAPQGEGEAEAGVFVPDGDLSPYDVVTAYFEQMYISYLSCEYIDLSSILDMSQSVNRNLVTWTKLLLQRRRLILEHDLAYVEMRMLPYSISFEGETGDERMEFWNARGQSQSHDERILHFVITGEAGEAYPPLMAMNSVHTIRLREVDGVWKITFHYFPGSVRKYYRSGSLTEMDDSEHLEMLMEEFADIDSEPEPSDIPLGAAVYNSAKAADYAGEYTERENPDFYNIGDWMGNCQNFISQAVWYGFSGDLQPSVAAMDNMTRSWFAGSGGGSPAWENVSYFWNYVTGQNEFRSVLLSGAAQLETGDIIQTRSLDYSGGSQSYSHSLLVVDDETLKLAQNSPGCFVYYSDVFNVETRMLRPICLLI